MADPDYRTPAYAALDDEWDKDDQPTGEQVDIIADVVERMVTARLGWCAWCEEAQAPAYLAHEGHDPGCPVGGQA